MNTFDKNFDALEQLIVEKGLRIETLDFHPKMDLMLIILNTKAVLHQKISSYPRLSKISEEQLSNYQIIAEGTGVHWSSVDEDLSLKGFLQDELISIVKGKAA